MLRRFARNAHDPRNDMPTDPFVAGDTTLPEPPLRVMSLHALAYCHRLFYLEEVEEIRVADARVYAGRELHASLEANEDGERTQLELADPWPSDRLQVVAYAALIESATGQAIPEGRVRYHADNVTVRVPIDEAARADLAAAIAEARRLRESTERPPVTENERLCVRCSLAPVCLPEETRQAEETGREPVRLFPPDRDGASLHVVTPGARVGRSGETLIVSPPDGEPPTKHAIRELDS